MIGWLLDTNVIAELIRPACSARVKAWAMGQPEVTLYLSILTIGEYDKAIANLVDDDARRPGYAMARDALADRFSDRLLPVANAVIRRWGVLNGTLRRDRGHPPPVIDTLLAATALEHDLYLATRNMRDMAPTGVALFNPWEDDPACFPLRIARRRRRLA